MGFSGGVFTRSDGTRTGATICAQQKAAAVKITASLVDNELNEIKAALDTCVLKDGTQTITAAMPLGSQRITGLAAGTASTDAATVGQIQNSATMWGGTSTNSANLQSITVTPSLTAYAAGQVFRFIPGYTNTSSLTLNVNGVGAKTVKRRNGATLTGGEVTVSVLTEVVYDGTDFRLLNDYIVPQATATIASGAISYLGRTMVVDTQGAASTDDLDTVNGGVTGDILIIRSTNDARDVVIKHGTGNLYLSGTSDFTLTHNEDTATFVSNGTDWLGLAVSNNT